MKRLLLFFLLFLLAMPAMADGLFEIPTLKDSYEIGDFDESLQIVKQRLCDLNYYSEGYTKDRILHGYFDAVLQNRISLFQAFNNLPVTGNLDQETLSLLFSNNAMSEAAFYKQDKALIPDYMLFTVGVSSQSHWIISNDYFNLQTQVINHWANNKVVAFELSIIPYNAWHERMISPDSYYSVVTLSAVKPGETTYSNYCCIDNYSEIYDIFVGVKRYRLDNGTIITIPENQILYHT